jgi:hypothetical protein
MTKLLDLEPADANELKALQDMVGKQARLMGELASKLRLTPQARYTAGSASTADRKSSGELRKPWQKG